MDIHRKRLLLWGVSLMAIDVTSLDSVSIDLEVEALGLQYFLRFDFLKNCHLFIIDVTTLIWDLRSYLPRGDTIIYRVERRQFLRLLIHIGLWDQSQLNSLLKSLCCVVDQDIDRICSIVYVTDLRSEEIIVGTWLSWLTRLCRILVYHSGSLV